MITLLRKIRKRLISKGKFSNYLLYAIGEIALVVLGILIALQVNTWKTESEHRSIEKEYYCQLLEDLDIDLVQLDELTQQAKSSIKVAKEIIVGLHGFQYEKDELLKEYIKSARTNFYLPTNTVFTDLMSSGNLRLLQNNELKKKLIRYQKEVENLNRILTDNKNLKIENFTKWDNVLEMGWQSPSISPGLNLDQKILDLLPKNNWHLDKENPYFIKFEEVIAMIMIIASREIELYQQIKKTTEPMYEQLKKACEANSL